MNNDLNKLLNKLEPTIDKKCMEIKKEKMQNISITILCLSFVTIPSILLLLNINIIYFVIAIIILFVLKFFISLPDILRGKLEVNCYE